MPHPQQQPIDLEAYVREVLDGVVGDIDLPTNYELPRFGEANPVDGLTDAQRAVFAQITSALVRRFRPLTVVERVRLAMAFVIEWNRRARAPSWFHTSDGRYFASEADRRAHQRTLDEKAARARTIANLDAEASHDRLAG